MAPTVVASLIINKTGGSSTPGKEITPIIPVNQRDYIVRKIS